MGRSQQYKKEGIIRKSFHRDCWGSSSLSVDAPLGFEPRESMIQGHMSYRLTKEQYSIFPLYYIVSTQYILYAIKKKNKAWIIQLQAGFHLFIYFLLK